MLAHLKKAGMAVLLAMLLSTDAAWAQTQQPAPVLAEDGVSLPVCTLAPDDASKLAVAPCRPAPTKLPARRRAVPQSVGPMLRSPAPVRTDGVHPAASQTRPQAPTAPVPLNACDTGGCRDAAGSRYNGGIGNATVAPDGKVCNRNGTWLQCF